MFYQNKHSRRGLVLLVVLGMLTLFSLLIVTFVVLSSNSKKDSVAINTIQMRVPDHRAISDLAIKQIIRGTTDPSSAIFKHSLLEDISQNFYASDAYGLTIQQSLRGGFRPDPTADAVALFGGTFLKLPLDPALVIGTLNSNTDPYMMSSVPDDAYNGRLITMLGGPLQNQTFRIVRYIGDRGSGDADFSLRNSVIVDISTIEGNVLTSKTQRGTQAKGWNEWASGNLREIAYDWDGGTNYRPYRFLINAAPFSGVGYGLSLNKTWPSSGAPAPNPNYSNLGMRVETGLAATPYLPASLFHNLSSRSIFPLTSDSQLDGWWNGGTNEGYDVPDYRDYFFSYRPMGTTTSQSIIPSFHRPELINHIIETYGSNITADQDTFLRFLQLIDFATARPLSVTVRDGNTQILSINPRFSGGPKPPGGPQSQLQLDLSNPSALPLYLAWLVNGPYDVDNDGDRITDSNWVDLNFPLVTSSDGKMLKILVAPMIEDLDGRLNIQSQGDLSQADAGFVAATSPAFNAAEVAQGTGFGPADISFSHLIGNLPAYYSGTNPFAYRYGKDGAPGQVTNSYGDNDDLDSQFDQREIEDIHFHGARGGAVAMGVPNARRGGFGYGVDLFGNPIVANNTYGGNVPSETRNDPYEAHQRKKAVADTPFFLEDLEKILRAYDSSSQGLPDRFRKLWELSQTNEISRIITTRSNELRHPSIGVPAGTVNSPVSSFPTAEDGRTAGNLLGWIKLLHDERYRNKPAPGIAFDPAIHDPELSYVIARQLFPVEFRRGLKLNLNRPFGDGNDNDGDGIIDDPQEMRATVQNETYPGDAPIPGSYFTGAFVPSRIELGTRQQLAQQLYCLAYLIVPKEYNFPGPTPANATERLERRARALAQWAVNIVDFRDGDSTCTKFPYDPYPFGAPGTPPRPIQWLPSGTNVVWGLEFPELQLSETLAFHDTRAKDTDLDDGPARRMPDDPDRDQYRLPQGSLFMELKTMRTTGNMNDPSLPAVSSALYTISGTGEPQLDLGRLVPAGPFNVGGINYGTQPVWRIGISDITTEVENPFYRLQTQTTTFASDLTLQHTKDPNGNGLAYSATEPVKDFSRIVWFANLDPSSVPYIPNIAIENGPNRHKYVYYNRDSSVRYISGGNYLVVGPRQTTYIGSQNSSATPIRHRPSPQRIVVNPNSVEVYRMDGTLQSLAGVAKPAMGMICATDTLSAAWNDIYVDPSHGMFGVGLNISEPDPVPGAYYRIPTQKLNSNDAGLAPYPGNTWGFDDLKFDSWYDDANPTVSKLPDTPFDTDPARNPVLTALKRPASALETHRTIRSAFLQRIADPEQPYDPVDNPYLTIDWMPIDLTVFNGEDSEPITTRIAFQSRYKNGVDRTSVNISSIKNDFDVAAPEKPSSSGKNQFSYSLSPLRITPTYPGTYLASTVTPYFNYQLGYSSYSTPDERTYSASSLGSLNTGRPIPSPPPPALPEPTKFDAFGPGTNATIDNFDGAPPEMQAGLYWLNRSYSSPLELMIVSGASPGQLNMRSTNIQTSVGAYTPTPADALPSPFGQLTNTFQSLPNMRLSNLASQNPPFSFWQQRFDPGSFLPSNLEDLRYADLPLLFELLETPPPFSDSTTWLRPNMVPTSVLPDLAPPYNTLPTYDNPGKINVNTIPGEAVWKGVELLYLPSSERATVNGNTTWPEVARSRQGYVPASTTILGALSNPNLNPRYPTQFAGAFRNGFQSNIAPEGLRKGSGNAVGLFQQQLDPSFNPTQNPLFNGATPRYANSERQPYVAYQRMMRLPNLVSTQSNIYAVRLTIGYFEFDGETGIGEEYVGSQGTPTRQRSFYIIDRSIPVGVSPGEDLNVDKTILLRRVAE